MPKGCNSMHLPLLSLGADQTRKVMKLAVNDDSVSAFHIDEMNDLSINHVLRSLKQLSPLKTVFYSPLLNASCVAIVDSFNQFSAFL